MATLKQGDSYLLQQRGYDPNIGAAGLIGFFGGKIEQDESPLAAVCREISEETTLVLDADRGRYLGSVVVPSDMYKQPIEVHASVFGFNVDPVIRAVAKEGDMITMSAEELRAADARLTPATLAWLKQSNG